MCAQRVRVRLCGSLKKRGCVLRGRQRRERKREREILGYSQRAKGRSPA